MYNYDFYSFIDSPDIREHLKKFDIHIAKQAVFIAISEHKSIKDKINALQYLLDNYSDEEFENYDETLINPSYKHPKISKVIKDNISYWKTLLERNNEDGRIYAVRHIDVGMSFRVTSNAYFTSYEKAYKYLMDEKEDYNDVKMYGEIESFVGDDSNIRITCSFDSDLNMYDIYHTNDEDDKYPIETSLDEFDMYIPLPFKAGDIVKEVSFYRTVYGVFPKDWEYNEENKYRVTDYITTIDGGEIDEISNAVRVYWDDTIYVPRLEYCSESELPKKHNILKYISDVRRGKYDWIGLVNDITNDFRAVSLCEDYGPCEGFRK